jgi:hypothetical protein
LAPWLSLSQEQEFIVMSIIVKAGGDFVPAPAGLHNAVCVDVVDKGLVDSQWGRRHKAQIVWEIAQLMEDGRPFTVRKMYTASLHEKSTLYKDLVAWRGKPFTAQELKGFDVENVVGTPCQVFVEHNERDGQIYANVRVVTKAPAGSKLTPSGHYVRVKDRQTEQQPQQRQQQQPPPGDFDEEPADNYKTVPADDSDRIPF